MNFYRRYPQGYLLFFHITGNSVEISCYIKSLTGRDRTAAEGNHVASDRARRGNVPGHILLKLNSLKGGTYSACVRRAEGERPELCRQRWEAVFRRERMPVSIDRLPYSDPERGTVHFYVEYMVLRLWKRCCRTDVS